MNATKIAESFVDLALKYSWGTVRGLPAEEVNILFETVSAAGFEPSKIVPGQLRGHYSDGCGSFSEDTYVINGTCPYKVIGKDGEDHYHATGWLDRVLSLAREGVAIQERIKAVQHEIERSVPLNPIQLTADGDFMLEYPPYRDYLVDHTREDSRLKDCVGVHDFCTGCMDRTRVTETHSALVCRRCHLRVLFPKEVTTYGELRQVLASKFTKVA